MLDSIAEYPSHLTIRVAWGDMDALGHVNNVVYIRWLESGRVDYMMHGGIFALMEDAGVGPILASIQCRYKAPVTFPDNVTIATRITSVSDDRVTMQHEIYSDKLQRVVAEGQGVVVAYDFSAGSKGVLPESVRLRIAELEGMDLLE